MLTEFNFIQSKANYSLFTKTTLASFIALLVYIDNIIILMSFNDSYGTKVQDFLSTKFKIRILGSLKYFLSMEVARSQKGIQIC